MLDHPNRPNGHLSIMSSIPSPSSSWSTSSWSLSPSESVRHSSSDVEDSWRVIVFSGQDSATMLLADDTN